MATGYVFPEEYILKLSQGLHLEPLPAYIFWQFVNEMWDFFATKSQKVKVNAPIFLPPLSNPVTGAQLATVQTLWSSVGVTTWAEQAIEIELQEYLMKPMLQLIEWDMRYAEHDVEDINQTMLKEHYFRWLDDLIIKRFADNTFRSYVGNNAGLAQLESTDLFTFTEIAKANHNLTLRKIPTYADGTRNVVVDPGVKLTLFVDSTFATLAASAAKSQSDVPYFTNEFVKVLGLRFIESNNIPQVEMGQSGTPFNGSQAFIFGPANHGLFPMGSRDGFQPSSRSDFLTSTGAGPIVKVTGMPAEFRLSEINDSGRHQKGGWIEHSEIQVADPNPRGIDGNGNALYAGKTKGVDSRFMQTLYGATVAAN